jgi:hypothetical protein
MSLVTPSNIAAAASLAFIANADEKYKLPEIKKAMEDDLGQIVSEAGGPWSLVWGPALNQGILAYVALSADKTQYALAIRGSLVNWDIPGFFHNWFDDLDAFKQVPWQYPSTVAGALIAYGTNDALSSLIGLIDPDTHVHLLDYLRSTFQNSGENLIVTGHSLGGCLTTVGAAWLHNQLPNVNITPFAFAPPTAGNQAFVKYYNSIFPEAYCCVNTWDIVPMAYENLAGIQKVYPAPSQTLRQFSPCLWEIVETAKLGIEIKELNYSQIEITEQFEGDLNMPPLRLIGSKQIGYFTEAKYQHIDAYPLYLESKYGIPIVIPQVLRELITDL